MGRAALWLLALIPVALGVHYRLDVAPIWTFAAGIAAIVPLAEWIRRGTEQIAHRAGSAIGGLLNATFGNTRRVRAERAARGARGGVADPPRDRGAGRVAIVSVALVVNAITRDGEATWFEGVLLLGVYVLLALAFFFATPPPSG